MQQTQHRNLCGFGFNDRGLRELLVVVGGQHWRRESLVLPEENSCQGRGQFRKPLRAGSGHVFGLTKKDVSRAIVIAAPLVGVHSGDGLCHRPVRFPPESKGAPCLPAQGEFRCGRRFPDRFKVESSDFSRGPPLRIAAPV